MKEERGGREVCESPTKPVAQPLEGFQQRCQVLCVIPGQWCCAEPHHISHFLSPLAVKWDIKWQNCRGLSETWLCFKIINLYWLNFLNIFQGLQRCTLFVCVMMSSGPGLQFYFGCFWRKHFFSGAQHKRISFLIFHQLLRVQSKCKHKLRTSCCLPC